MSPNLSPGARLGRYEIKTQLGAGGMGEVWCALDTRLDREVAIKLLPASLASDVDRLRRFEQEAKAASALNHPGIVTIHEIGEMEAGHFIVMELVRGQTLRAIAKPCAIDLLVNIGDQIARALTATHAAGITHRDIKPDNIMVRDDGYIKLLDFGVARLVPQPASGEEAVTLAYRTLPGTLLGTLAYMSPEQAHGQHVGPATDIFALGVVFYELVTGRHPFKADSMIGIMNAIISLSPAPPSRANPEVPASLDGLIMRMLEKDAVSRPTAVEVSEVLADVSGVRSSGQRQRAIRSFAERHTVGRDKERAELMLGVESALAGRGLLLCVAGEPGIGKTTLVEDFLAALAAEGRCTIARGRCSERLAGTEAYLPLLEALESLLQGGSNPAAARVMRQISPSWYAQVVSITAEGEELARLLSEGKAASQERMKRELAAFLQEVSRLRPLVLFFDDLHWADVSTIDLLSFLAGKFDAMSVLIVVTYRPSDMLLAKHPFLQIKPDLQARGLCRELQLEFLSQGEITEYLALEFPGHRFPTEFPKVIHEKTEGSPLFMADLLRYLRDRGAIAQADGHWMLARTLSDVERELPESVRGMIERKVTQLNEEDRKLLVAASVQGYEFDSAVVAEVLSVEPAEVEERLEKLERVHAFVGLVEEREFPDRTLTLRYRFVHVLYQNALYGSLRATRKAQMNSAIARALEGYYGEKSEAVAHELARLWEAARDYLRAADYFLLAARHAFEIHACQEAAVLAGRGLELLQSLPETLERNQRELALQVAAGAALRFTKGFGSSDVGRAYQRARELCERTGDMSQLVTILRGLWEFHELRAEYDLALEFGNQLLAFAQEQQDTSLLLVAHDVLGDTFVWLGDFVAARNHLEQGIALYDAEQHHSHVFLYGYDSGMACLSFLALPLWYLGYSDQALKRAEEALGMARALTQSLGLIQILFFTAWIHQLRGERDVAQEQVEEVIATSDEQGFPVYSAAGRLLQGVLLAEQGKAEEGVALMRAGSDAHRAAGTQLGFSVWSGGWLGEALIRMGSIEEGSKLLSDALDFVVRTGERFHEGELYRLKGEAMLKLKKDSSEAVNCFLQAIEAAQRQQAKSTELRAVMSLCRLWQKEGETERARVMLANSYNWFTEGFDTADLKDAKALLSELQEVDRVGTSLRRTGQPR